MGEIRARVTIETDYAVEKIKVLRTNLSILNKKMTEIERKANEINESISGIVEALRNIKVGVV